MTGEPTVPLPDPFDPSCRRYAVEMPELDDNIREDGSNRRVTAIERARYVRAEEGTYNPANGHFLCDVCYIKAGMPVAPGGWKCP